MHRYRTVTLLLAAMCCVAGSLADASGAESTQRPIMVGHRSTDHVPRVPATHRAAQRAATPSRHTDSGRKHTGRDVKADRPEQRTIAAGISDNPKLRAKVERMLPAGMTIEQASAGFRNQGQFIAALNASNNHNISFADLKAAMTGSSALSLAEAVQKLKSPSASKSK